VGQPYSFAPKASDADGDTLGFAISGKPSWATFNTTTGVLSGTPGSANVGSYSNIVISVSDGKASVALTAFAITVTAVATSPPPVGATDGLAPLVLYTDIQSGPNTGGENGDGIYLTVFGKNFGSGKLGVDVKVYINDVEVKRYMNPGQVPVLSRGRSDIQQIATQIGSLGLPAATAGSAPSAPMAVKVMVNGRLSNPDQASAPDPQFQVNPGNIYFVSPTGTDTTSTTSGGEFQSPFRSVQKPGIGLTFSIQPASTSGAYGRVRAGDFIVMRGGTYTGVGFGGSGTQGYFMQALNKSGCPVGTKCAQGGGSSSGPITLMGYPGETAFIDRTNSTGDDQFGGGISSADSARAALGMGAWWNVVNLKIESGYNDGAINTQMSSTNPLGSHWRVVNNELTGNSCQISTKCRAGGISGSGEGSFWVGNHIHDVYDKPDSSTSLENHGIYINSGGSFEIAYNWIENIPGGNGIQIHAADYVDNLSVHHNIIQQVGKHGINLAEGSRNNILVWNNLVFQTQSAGLRMGGTSYIQGLKVFNNVFYKTGMVGNTPSSGALTNEMNVKANQMEIRNNIVWPKSGSAYSSGSFSASNGIYSNNLWYGASGAPSFSSASLSVDPQLVDPDFGDFHLKATSPAIDAGSSAVATLVKDDFDAATSTRSQTLRPQGSAIDIGAFEQ
jgi:hypothetical protein